MCRIFWDTILLITGSLFTFGAGQGNSIIDTGYAITATSTSITTTSSTSAPPPPPPPYTTASTTSTTTITSSTTISTTSISTTRKIPPVKKFVVAAVRSHFDDCPDSHSHFCFHGTCRFLIQEETPACVCHPGFVGMRCEHADLLAVVANNHRPQTLATALVLCVIGCVLMMLFCTLLHCLWRQDCSRRRRHVLHYVPDKTSSMEKGRASSYCPSESVV